MAIFMVPTATTAAVIIYLKHGRKHGVDVFHKRTVLSRDLKEFQIRKVTTMFPPNEDETQDVIPGILARTLSDTGLDEAFQLLEVLKGKMVLIGVRINSPEDPKFLEKANSAELSGEYQRTYAKAGASILGLAQISRRRKAFSGEEPAKIRSRMRYDIFYGQRASLGLDLLIIWGTIDHALGKMAENSTKGLGENLWPPSPSWRPGPGGPCPEDAIGYPPNYHEK